MTLEEAQEVLRICDRYCRMTAEEAQELPELRFSDSYNRLPKILGLAYLMPDDEWLRLLGMEWSGFDNVTQHADELIWNTPFGCGGCREMMDEAEQAAYDALPDIVTVYRGCYANNKRGLSWTLDREVAEKFPFMHRYRQPGQPLLVTARVKKTDIIAVKLDRDESEVIAWRPKIVSTRYIRADPWKKAA